MLSSLVNSLIILLAVPCTFLHFAKAEVALFLLNLECTSVHSCIGDVHDISVVCLNSKCVCDPRLGVYDPLNFHCVGKADHACLADRCTRNSVCEATTNTCKCHTGYQISVDGRCVQGHDGICEEDEDCKQGFLCYDGKCDCRYPNHQYYHAENDTCVSIAQSWHNDLKNAVLKAGGNDDHSDGTGRKSNLYFCLELFLLLGQVAVLVCIAVFLAKIGNLLKDIFISFKLHGYFLRTSLDGRTHDTATLEASSFFDGDSKA